MRPLREFLVGLVAIGVGAAVGAFSGLLVGVIVALGLGGLLLGVGAFDDRRPGALGKIGADLLRLDARRYGGDSSATMKPELSEVEVGRRRALVALGSVLLCGVAVLAWVVAFRMGVAGFPAPSGTLTAETATLNGQVVFGEPSGRLAEVSPGQGLLEAVQRTDVVEIVDLSGRDTYSFQLWPGAYTLRVGAELPVGNDDFCTQEVRIKARQARRAIIHCTPIERQAKLRSRA